MTTFEQVQRRLWDSLMDHERHVFFQLIQGELPTLTVRELGEILTSQAARSVADLPASALLTAATPPPRQAQHRPARAPTTSAARHRPRSTAPRTSTERPSPRTPPAADRVRTDTPSSSAEPVRAKHVESATPLPVTPQAPPSIALTLELAPPLPPVPTRSHVAAIQSAVSRTLAQRSRQDPDAQVVAALRAVGDWIRARDLRPRVGLRPDDLRAVLNRLVKAGTVQRDGEGPETVYRLVGDGRTDVAASP